MNSLLRRSGTRSASFAGDIGLWVVLIATVIAAGIEIWAMIEARSVKLTDILLLFIYLEVITMVDVYWRTGRLPVRMPLYIAMVAMARYIILEAAHLGPWHVIGLSGAILILALAVLVVRFGHLKYPYAETKGANLTGPDDECPEVLEPARDKRRVARDD
ncbi:phosphate-starvation-inducible PsiE family protein [Wenzhouxiangella sp. XN79A]|uniref:phosphate-starvation-inducible protein PsiE n=1 Tax=Wenzhouxiangella sp. XN79A TaxID=2724193 RepID=UPI00144A5B9D|nr:phosphate-starvation-inducible PsiE family protein [Wenzhouxiangella sp. XN79A]NKI34852.1 phosphate-starvation-inducible PsiE family protein [Wenzhouxiangella sp. XN79A]